LSENKEKKILDLKEGEDNVSIKARVIKVSEPKIIQTRKGPKTISEAVIGDETGRVKLTLWGKHAGTLKEGETVEISGAWTTQYRGDVQVNVGYKGEIKNIPEEEVVSEEEIPESVPKAENPYQPRRRSGGFGYKKYGKRSY
jgi:replication factor A1